MSSGIAEKGQIGTVFTDEIPTPAKGNLHYVNRNGDDTPRSFEEELIPGYDATFMGARATLRAAEEKKLLRRIGWHLILLLALRSNIDGGIRYLRRYRAYPSAIDSTWIHDCHSSLSRRTVRLPNTGGVYARRLSLEGSRLHVQCPLGRWVSFPFRYLPFWDKTHGVAQLSTITSLSITHAGPRANTRASLRAGAFPFGTTRHPPQFPGCLQPLGRYKYPLPPISLSSSFFSPQPSGSTHSVVPWT
ncbi:hypothetical protein ACN42_g10876 [Penicillium freii]|uniref:Uncharacterized protein n=1 Tax=Penicillium freii TaxID=48697 RepID=A0A101M989_PENFR|nr:hypothetical protein ACN42_g10876 [Penicillium freii]